MSGIKKIASLLLVVLYVGYYASTHFFFHSHDYGNGTVTHSHPYTSGGHTHSANALQFIAVFANTLFDGGAAIFVLALFLILKEVVFSFHKHRTLKFLIGCNLLRAPPALA